MNNRVEDLRQQAVAQEKRLKALGDAKSYEAFGRGVRSYQRIIAQLTQFEQAEKYWTKTARYYEYALKHIEDDNTWLVASLTDDLASVYQELLSWGEWKRDETLAQINKVLKLHQRAAQIYYDMGEYISYAGVHINIVGAYIDLSSMFDGREAIEYLYKADEACHLSMTYRDVDTHARDYASLQDNHGAVHLELAVLENFEENIRLSLEARHESAQIFERLDMLHDYALSEASSASTLQTWASELDGDAKLKKLKASEQHYRNALEHLNRDSDLEGFIFANINFGNTLTGIGRFLTTREAKLRYYDEAISVRELALRLIKDDAMTLETRVTAMHNLANTHKFASEIEDATYHLQRAESLYLRVIKANFSTWFTFSSYQSLGEIYQQLGKRKENRYVHMKMLQLSRETDMEDNIENITNWLIQTETLIEKLKRWLGLIRY